MGPSHSTIQKALHLTYLPISLCKFWACKPFSFFHWTQHNYIPRRQKNSDTQAHFLERSACINNYRYTVITSTGTCRGPLWHTWRETGSSIRAPPQEKSSCECRDGWARHAEASRDRTTSCLRWLESLEWWAAAAEGPPGAPLRNLQARAASCCSLIQEIEATQNPRCFQGHRERIPACRNVAWVELLEELRYRSINFKLEFPLSEFESPFWLLITTIKAPNT